MRRLTCDCREYPEEDVGFAPCFYLRLHMRSSFFNATGMPCGLARIMKPLHGPAKRPFWGKGVPEVSARLSRIAFFRIKECIQGRQSKLENAPDWSRRSCLTAFGLLHAVSCRIRETSKVSIWQDSCLPEGGHPWAEIPQSCVKNQKCRDDAYQLLRKAFHSGACSPPRNTSCHEVPPV